MSSLTNAEAYFAPTNHIRAASWEAYSPELKAAAIAQAKRVLNRIAQLSDIEDELDDTDDYVNPEYAIYEQALWMLQNEPMANADESFSVVGAADPETDSNARKKQTAVMAPEALRWLVRGGNLTLSRG